MFRAGKAGLFYYLVAGRWFSAPALDRSVDVRDADAAGGLQEDPARASAIARARGGARAPTKRTRRCCSRSIPQTARVNRKEVKAPDVAYQGDPEFQPIERHDGRARGEHRQGHHQGRRPATTCASRRCGSCRRRATGPWEVATSVPKEIYTIPASSPSHNVTYVTVEGRRSERRLGDVRLRRRLHRHDGRVGLRRVGHRLVLPAVRVATAAMYPVYYGVPAHLRLRAPGTTRGPAPTAARAAVYGPLRRRRRRRRLQPAHRHLRARRGGLRSVRIAQRRAGVQPAHRHRPRRRARDRTSTATGDRRPCSAATTGRARRTRRTTAPARPRAASDEQRRRRGHRARAVAGRTTVGRTGRRRRVRRSRRQRLSQGRQTAAGSSGTTAAGSRRTSRRQVNPSSTRTRARGRPGTSARKVRAPIGARRAALRPAATVAAARAAEEDGNSCGDDRLLAALGVIALAGACAPATNLTAVWSAPQVAPVKFKKVLVAAQSARSAAAAGH